MTTKQPIQVRERFVPDWEQRGPKEKLSYLAKTTFNSALKVFMSLSRYEQIERMRIMTEEERKRWLNQFPPDDIADVMQELFPHDRIPWLMLVPERIRSEVAALMAYAEDAAGGLMTPRF